PLAPASASERWCVLVLFIAGSGSIQYDSREPDLRPEYPRRGPMTETAIASHGQAAARASHLAATLVCLAALLAPALWNGYPLLEYDTGGYLARWYEGDLVPSRSTVFGLFVHAGEGFHFWPELVLQSGCAVWVIWLVLRVVGLGTGPWLLATVIAGLSLLTGLSVLSSTLLTDIFAGLAVLSLHLLIFHRSEL